MNLKQTTTAALTLLCENFNREMTPELVATYVIGLGGLDPAKILQAAKRAIQQDEAFMPTAGQLRALCLTPIHHGQSPDRDARGKYIPLLDSVLVDHMLAAIEAVSSRHAGDGSVTRELAIMEKNIRKRRKTETTNEVER